MDEGLADLLHRVVMLLGEAARRRTDDRDGLTYSQIRLLGTLEDIEPVTQHQLAQALSVSDPAISRALRPLETGGMVTVTIDPEHARRRLVRITEAGRNAFHTAGSRSTTSSAPRWSRLAFPTNATSRTPGDWPSSSPPTELPRTRASARLVQRSSRNRKNDLSTRARDNRVPFAVLRSALPK
ncbi:MarR family transcriptional regulator [Spirillospora sp. NPDC052269]